MADKLQTRSCLERFKCGRIVLGDRGATIGRGITMTLIELGHHQGWNDELEQSQVISGPSQVLGSWLWALDTGTLTASRAIADAFCVDPQRARLGAPIADYFPAVHPDDRARFDADVTRSVETGSEFFCEYRVVDRNGATRWLWDRGQCIEMRDGQPLRYLGVVVDVTRTNIALDSVAGHLMAARAITQRTGESMLRYFIDMALHELASRMAARQKHARRTPRDRTRAGS